MINKATSNPVYLCKSEEEKEREKKLQSEELNNIEIESQIEYILETAEVTELQDRLCARINLSNTIIFQSESRKNDRSDSRISSLSLRPSCDMIRRCDPSDVSLCERCDKEYASLLLGASTNKLRSLLYNKIHKNKHEFPIQDDNVASITPEVLEINGIYCIKYHCPMLGYIEAMFPIRFEGRIIALLILGQIKLSEEAGSIRKTTEKFIESRKPVFQKYIDKVMEEADLPASEKWRYTFDEIKKFIMCGDKKQSTDYIDIYKHYDKPHFKGMLIPSIDATIEKPKLDEIITDTCNWILRFEETLRKRMSEKRSERLKNYFDDEQLKFFEEINAKNLDNNQMEILWNNVSSSIRKLCAKCHLQSISMYSIGKNKKLKRVSYTEGHINNYTLISLIEKRIPNLLKLPSVPYDSITKGKVHDNNHEKTLSDLFSFFPNSGPYILLFLPRREIPEASIFVLLEKSMNEYTDSIISALLSGLRNYVILLSAQVATISENSLQIKINHLFRFFRHETLNLANDFERAIYTLENVARGRQYSKNKLKNTAEDANASLELFTFISENFDDKIVEGVKPSLLMVDFDMYDLIYKWENVRRHDLHDRNCEIVYEKRKVPVHSDSRYLEIIVYNLISNAVKYSYEETKIHIDCRRDKNNTSGIVFSIRNFSFGVPENEREMIFKNGYRCETAMQYAPEGSGIGLWLCKTIAGYFNGDIALKEQEKISNYNVPILKHLIENKEFHDIISPEEMIQCQEAYNSLKDRKILCNDQKVDLLRYMVSDWCMDLPTAEKVVKMLHTPTYLLDFEVVIYE